MIRAAFVVPSLEARGPLLEVAARLAGRGHPIEVLILDAADVISGEPGLSVLRFDTQEKMLEHLRREHARDVAVVFAGCRHPLTLAGIRWAGRRALLVPLLGEGTAAELAEAQPVFEEAGRILFASEDEAAAAARLFGPALWRRAVITGTPAQAGWDEVLSRYEKTLEPRRPARIAPLRGHGRAIHQLLPSLDYGDAIGNQTVFTSEALRELGYESRIFCYDIGAPMVEFATRFEPGVLRPDDGLIYHHAIGTDLTPHAMRHPGPKALVYHNITPGHFFAPWDPKFAAILDWGRKDLHNLARAFPVSVGDSSYNAGELREAGFRDPGVMPIFVDPGRWALRADPQWMKMLQDGRTNILFVGRVAPNKRQEHLIAAFKEYLAFDPHARLILAGVWPPGSPYARFLREEAERLGIGSQVFLTWKVTDAQLMACYRTAHLFWSMSEHEGFCVPLIEAMWFDVPVLAYRSSAIPETMGEAGMLFSEKRLPELAALAHLLVTDGELRRKVIAAQRARRTAFLPEAILPVLRGLVEKMGVAGDAASQPARLEMSSEYPSMITGQR